MARTISFASTPQASPKPALGWEILAAALLVVAFGAQAPTPAPRPPVVARSPVVSAGPAIAPDLAKTVPTRIPVTPPAPDTATGETWRSDAEATIRLLQMLFIAAAPGKQPMRTWR